MKSTSKGLVLASTVAALFAASSSAQAVAQAPMTEEATVHCGGINSCKGTSECKTATNGCKGQNACKGQGFVTTTEADCTAKGGKVLQ